MFKERGYPLEEAKKKDTDTEASATKIDDIEETEAPTAEKTEKEASIPDEDEKTAEADNKEQEIPEENAKEINYLKIQMNLQKISDLYPTLRELTRGNGWEAYKDQINKIEDISWATKDKESQRWWKLFKILATPILNEFEASGATLEALTVKNIFDNGGLERSIDDTHVISAIAGVSPEKFMTFHDQLPSEMIKKLENDIVTKAISEANTLINLPDNDVEARRKILLESKEILGNRANDSWGEKNKNMVLNGIALYEANPQISERLINEVAQRIEEIKAEIGPIDNYDKALANKEALLHYSYGGISPALKKTIDFFLEKNILDEEIANAEKQCAELKEKK